MTMIIAVAKGRLGLLAVDTRHTATDDGYFHDAGGKLIPNGQGWCASSGTSVVGDAMVDAILEHQPATPAATANVVSSCFSALRPRVLQLKGKYAPAVLESRVDRTTLFTAGLPHGVHYFRPGVAQQAGGTNQWHFSWPADLSEESRKRRVQAFNDDLGAIQVPTESGYFGPEFHVIRRVAAEFASVAEESKEISPVVEIGICHISRMSGAASVIAAASDASIARWMEHATSDRASRRAAFEMAVLTQPPGAGGD